MDESNAFRGYYGVGEYSNQYSNIDCFLADNNI